MKQLYDIVKEGLFDDLDKIEGKNSLENGQSVSRNPRGAELFPSRVAQVIWHS